MAKKMRGSMAKKLRGIHGEKIEGVHGEKMLGSRDLQVNLSMALTDVKLVMFKDPSMDVDAMLSMGFTADERMDLSVGINFPYSRAAR